MAFVCLVAMGCAAGADYYERVTKRKPNPY
jgi:hypothetical protein